VALDSPRNKICRHCAAEILLWGLKDWWIRERRKGFLEEQIANRLNCPEGNICARQKDDHGKYLASVVSFLTFRLPRACTRVWVFFDIYEPKMKMTMTIDNHIFSGTESSDCEGEPSTTAVPPVVSGNESTSLVTATSSAGSLSFLLNADNVEVDNQFSIRNQPFPSSDTHDMTDVQLS